MNLFMHFCVQLNHISLMKEENLKEDFEERKPADWCTEKRLIEQQACYTAIETQLPGKFAKLRLVLANEEK